MAKQVKTKTAKQVKFLLSSASPLSKEQRKKLQKELHSGAVKISKPKGSKRGSRK